MNSLRMLSWNVNGIRAVHRKGFLDWVKADGPDILCLQEIKAKEGQIPRAVRHLEGYRAYFVSGDRAGYGGVALFTRTEPSEVRTGLGIPGFDDEGRAIVADYGDFILYDVYFPNGKASPERLDYKMRFYEAFLDHVGGLLDQGKKIVICGDVNTAHQEIDLARPGPNRKFSGFLPLEREWMDRLVSRGFLDSFRMFHSEGGHYSWWDLKSRARERNVGWRIDYFFVSRNLQDQVESAFILNEVQGSDHCPVGIRLKV
ncbi:MAG: exodeoxyribonuclease III [Methanosarcinales archaeon]|nr:exodeoxyribonuclease III [Methanosarcinales archaeon]